MTFLIRLLIGLALLTAPAVAQVQVRQTGDVTPRHPASWNSTGVIQDGGTPANPVLTGLGVVSTNQQSICTQNAIAGAPLSQLCLGVTPTAGYLTLQSYGGGADLPFNIVINGTTYPFPGPVVGPFCALSGCTYTGPVIFNSTMAANAGGVLAGTFTGNPVLSGNIGLGSLVVGSPTGGNKGAGTVNATAYYLNGTSLGSGPFLPLAGGTVTGATIFSGGLTSNILTVGSPGGAAPSTGDVDISGAFKVNGVSVGTGPFLPLTGGTVSGATTFSSTLSAIGGGSLAGIFSGSFSLTGTPTVGGAAQSGAAMAIDSVAGSLAQIAFQHSALNRWFFQERSDAENSPDNGVGSGFAITPTVGTNTFPGFLLHGTRASGSDGAGPPFFDSLAPWTQGQVRSSSPNGTYGNFINLQTNGNTQPTRTLPGTTPFSTTASAANVFVFAAGCCDVGQPAYNVVGQVFVSLHSAANVGGVSMDVCGLNNGSWYKVNSLISVNEFTVSMNATCAAAVTTANGGGSGSTYTPSYSGILNNLYSQNKSGTPGFQIQEQRIYVANPSFFLPNGTNPSANYQMHYTATYSPAETSGTFAYTTIHEEDDFINRGIDNGWSPFYYRGPNSTIGFFWNAESIINGAPGGGSGHNWGIVAVCGASANTVRVGVYGCLNVAPGALVGADFDPTGHGGVGSDYFGSYLDLGNLWAATHIGTSTITVTASGIELFGVAGHAGTVYFPYSYGPFSGVTIAAGTYTMANITSTTFDITATGSAGATGTFGAPGSVAMISQAKPFAPYQVHGWWRQGFTMDYASYLDDGLLIHSRPVTTDNPGGGIGWDDGTGIAKVTGTEVSAGNVSVDITPAGTAPINANGPLVAALGTIKPSAVYDATACTSNGCPGTGTACVWDGAITHDAAPCIAAAAAAACASTGGGAEIDLPALVIPMGSDVVPSCDLLFKGRGAGITIIRSMPSNVSNPMLFGLSSISNVTFEDLTLDGDASGGATVTQASVFTGHTSGSSTALVADSTSTTPTAIGNGQFLYCTGCTVPVRITGGTYPNFTMSQAVTIAANTPITGVVAGMQGSIATNTLTLFGTVSGAPLQAGQTVYWHGGSAVLASGSGLNWTFTTSPGTVAFQPMFAAPGAGLVPLVTAFRTTNVKMERVTFQHSAGIGFNGSGVNSTSFLADRFVDIGNRWKATLTFNDFQISLSLCCGDFGISNPPTLGNHNIINASYFGDVASPIQTGSESALTISNSIFNLTDYMNAILPGQSAYPGALSIYVNGGLVLSGNQIIGGSGNCIDTAGLQDATISDNAIQNCGQAGIGLFQAGTGVAGRNLQVAQPTAQFGATATGTGTGTALALTGISGNIYPGSAASATITGTGVPASTYIVSGSAGSYVTNNATTSSGATITVSSNVMDVTAITGPDALYPGQALGAAFGNPLPVVPTYILSQTSGTTGSTGKYTTSQTQYLASGVLFGGMNTRHVTLSGNTIKNAYQCKCNLYDAGITIANGTPDGITLGVNTISDDQPTPTMAYGVHSLSTMTSPDWRVAPVNVVSSPSLAIAGAVTADILGLAPTLTGCGGGSPTLSADATNERGTITEGTTATGCVATWVPRQKAPICTVTSPGGFALTSYSATATALTLVNGSASGNTYTYQCSP